MKTALNILTGFLLLFNSIGATYGGLHLVLHPNGSSIGLSEHYLETTPFSSYFIPGIILLLANGVGSLCVLILLIARYRNYPWFVIAQGAVLTGWIIIQILLVQMVYFLHYIMGGTGVALILLGCILLRLSKKSQSEELNRKIKLNA